MMPAQQRFRYASHAACLYFAGFSSGVVASIVVEAMIRPESITDTAKFNVGTLIAIYAIFTLFTSALTAFGSFFATYLFPAAVRSAWHWVIAFGLGCFNAVGMLGVVYVYEADLLSIAGLSVLSASGFFIAFMLKPIGLLIQVARPWYPPGLCQACGYDLRKTPTDAPCPECGTLAGAISL